MGALQTQSLLRSGGLNQPIARATLLWQQSWTATSLFTNPGDHCAIQALQMAARHLIVNKRGAHSDGCPAARPKRDSSAGVTIAISLFLIAINLAVFGQTIRYDFVNFDDDLYVYNAPVIRAGLTINGLAAAFIRPHAHNWHPLTTISHMLDCQLYGLNAGGHHVTNFLLHT